MGVTKQLIQEGNKSDYPKNGDNVTMEYTGWLAEADGKSKGKQFDSSVGRGDFDVPIGTGRVIKGWDEGIVGTSEQEGMSLGEKSTLIITHDYGYGARGFPGAIPGGATLIFDVTLKAINGKRA
ncbi:FKBP-type peptidyl-prolyl isomeras-like protein [Aureobasidium pullulans]|uniref:peptidylprolyl isomerase n=2 Tax=Aureobasidium pullulans TaxID=5580 RepID=A0A074XF13_AURPU|nr:FKBP-type peptidyl-prolyl isomeras-like protein [Aureobasidium pullulans EXF-150]KEQ80607.1 FKBP-type peptidyl-prolyl isomeras-like protein [Aureobasidium pullulans EXF-150]THZ54610.1 FKBP-type peptidyl-prolyl isomeras-like protein [Aureobasidium pullulans]TIA35575.1 FKBP-type peptidyl-prolyl isomeras-like protein [Aureobasidium pullulans]